eukprot:NODE_720_length_4814_cov_0.354613.p5 type:complete len:103 gc:universal NODE_720_length_4814_cov_0.354613:704-396(-)
MNLRKLCFSRNKTESDKTLKSRNVHSLSTFTASNKSGNSRFICGKEIAQFPEYPRLRTQTISVGSLVNIAPNFFVRNFCLLMLFVIIIALQLSPCVSSVLSL